MPNLSSSQIDVSFVVIAFNEEMNISDSITSILNQDTDLRFELIVVDDGSTDRTVQEAKQAAANDARVRVISNPKNLGRGMTRAAGISLAMGVNIAFIDADIIIPKDWLSRTSAELAENAAVSGIATPDGDVAPISRVASVRPRSVGGSMPITGNNLLIRGNLIRSIGFPQSAQGEDFRLAAQLMKAGHSLKQISDLIVLHQEAKTYRKFLRWMFISGVDATNLLSEHLKVRNPDLAWAIWMTTFGPIFLGLATSKPIVLLAGLILNLLSLLGISLLHSLKRFDLFPFKNWVHALLLTIPAMSLYLFGRAVGLFRRAN